MNLAWAGPDLTDHDMTQSHTLTGSEKAIWSSAFTAHLAAARLKRVDQTDVVEAANWATDVLDALVKVAQRDRGMLERGLTGRALQDIRALLGDSPDVQAGEAPDPSEVKEEVGQDRDGRWWFTVSVNGSVLYEDNGYGEESRARNDMKRYRVMAEQFVAKGKIPEISQGRERQRLEQVAEAARPVPPAPTVTISGERLAYARKMAEISVPAALKTLRSEVPSITAIECGTPAITLALLKKLSTLYGVSDAYLTTLEPATIQAYQADKRLNR